MTQRRQIKSRCEQYLKKSRAAPKQLQARGPTCRLAGVLGLQWGSRAAPSAKAARRRCRRPAPPGSLTAAAAMPCSACLLNHSQSQEHACEQPQTELYCAQARAPYVRCIRDNISAPVRTYTMRSCEESNYLSSVKSAVFLTT